MLDISRITITTLSENSVADIPYAAEWGLSFHIAIKGGPTLLFDTGGGDTCVHNANIAGIRLSDIDMILLSHGHADHTGGLRSVLRQIRDEKARKNPIDIFCHPAALEPQFIKRIVTYDYQGCPYDKEELISLGANFITSREPQWFTEDILFSGEIPMQTDFESVAPILFLKRDGEYLASSARDDQSLFFKTDRGLLIVAGCAHRGIINTIMHARKLTGMEDVYMVIGGTHLLNTSPRQQQMTLKNMKALGVRKIGVSHCTGMKAASFLAHELGFTRFFFNNAGTAISFEDHEAKIASFEKYE